MVSGRKSKYGINFKELAQRSGLHEATIRKRFRDNPNLTPEELIGENSRYRVDGKTLFEIAKETGISYGTIFYRYKHGARTYQEITNRMVRSKKADNESAEKEVQDEPLSDATVEEESEQPAEQRQRFCIDGNDEDEDNQDDQDDDMPDDKVLETITAKMILNEISILLHHIRAYNYRRSDKRLEYVGLLLAYIRYLVEE